MSRLPVRLSLLFLCLAAIGGAAFLIWSTERTAQLDARSFRQFDTAARAARIGIAELRAAQQSYVATGQGEDFWFARVTAIRKDLDDRLSGVKSLSTAPEAGAAADEAMGALQDFSQMDQRARDYTRGRQLTLASDMIFGDGFELTKKAGDAVERAMTAEQVARDAAGAPLRTRQLLALAGAASIAILGMLILVPVPRSKVGIAIADVPVRAPARDTRFDDLDEFARVIPTPAAPPRASRPAARASAPLSVPASAPVPTPTPAAPSAPAAALAAAIEAAPATRSARVNLQGMAALCGDLARTAETQALASLLGRAAEIIDASGIVLWIADPDGRELAPILVHGYPAQLATRLGTIGRDAENVTASAYRTSLLQAVKGDGISSGAIAVPLVASGGCVGVMAAEVRNGGEQQEDLLAAATIIAAQLATLVGPPQVRTKAEAAG